MYESDDFQAEQSAYEAFTKLMADASRVRSLFEAARVPIPVPLGRFLGIGNQPEDRSKKLVMPPPPSPPRPVDAKADWIWVRVGNMTPYSLALALLRANGAPLQPAILAKAIKELLPGINFRSVYNLKPPRLRGVTSADGEWSLDIPASAPIIHEKYAWGPASVFLPQELTIHRRSLVLHLLRASADGLMAMQIVRQLQESDLCKTTVNKDLVQGDIEVLASEKQIKRIGYTKKWTAANDWSKDNKYA